jgi:serine phosphatase RsbU (regulator of sigma subunit)
MPGPFHLTADSCRVLELPGLPPGLFENTQYDAVTLELTPGDSVLFCSDGITDASTSPTNPSMSNEYRRSAITGCLPPRELLARIFKAVKTLAIGRDQNDDMAAAAFHYGLLIPLREGTNATSARS